MGGPPAAPADKSRRGSRILIIDDQDDVRLALQSMLSLDGWDTDEAASGEEAVARVGRTPDFAALVVDYKMPDLDGIEVTRRIRESGFERPIIICSAYLNPEVEREASALRARAVSKDHLGDLRETIGRQIRADSPEEREQAFHPHPVRESSDAAIVDTTLEGIVESWNPSAERIYGYSAEEMIGRPVWHLVPADHHNELPEILQKVERGERVSDYEAMRETKGGRLIEVSLSISPIRDTDGNIVGASTSSRAVTERKGPEKKFGALLEAAQGRRLWQSAVLLLVAAIYFGLARLGLLEIAGVEQISAIWPAAGFLVGVLLLSERRAWPSLLLVAGGACLAAQLVGGRSVAVASGLAGVNCAESLLTALVVGRFSGGRFSLTGLGPVLALLVGAVVAVAIAALLGAAVAALGLGSPYWKTWLLWWIAHGVGIAVVTPVVLLLAGAVRHASGRPPSRAHLVELGVGLAGLAAVALAIFSQSPGQAPPLFAFPYLTFPFLLWAALRFELPGVVLANLVLAVVAATETLAGSGPFSNPAYTGTEHLLQMQAFLAIVSSMSLLLATIPSELLQAEGQFRDLLESAPDAMVIAGNDGLITLVNRRTEELFGYRREELFGQPAERLIPKLFRDRWPFDRGCYLADPTARPMGGGLELLAKRKDGTEFPVEVSLGPLKTDNRTVAIVAIREVTERKRAEEQFRAFTETAPDAIVTADSAGRITYVNRTTVKLFGYDSEELVGEPLSTLMPERFREAHARGLKRFMATGEPRVIGRTVELAGLRRGGREFPLELSLGTWTVGEETFFAGFIRDISERKRGEEAQALAAIVESSDDAIIGETLEGMIASWNKGAERIYGYTAAEVVGKPIALLIPEERVDELPGMVERVRHGERVDHYETVRRAKDGRLLQISLTISPVMDAEGRLSGASAICRDITETKEARERLRHLSGELQQKVTELSAANTELEAFSYSVSHDLRGPLRAIDGFSRAVIEDYGGRLDEEGRGLLDEVRAGSQRMGRLIDELLTLSRLTRKELRPGSVDLSALANEIGSELEAQAPGRHVDLVVEEGLVAEGDAELLEIALRNLLGNAWKFTAGCTEPRIELRREAINGHSAYVVRDNGAGFDMRYAEKLFRPFERLHRQDEFPGIGVGLATVQRVVRRHGGTVWADGQVGEGAAFFFDLPKGKPE